MAQNHTTLNLGPNRGIQRKSLIAVCNSGNPWWNVHLLYVKSSLSGLTCIWHAGTPKPGLLPGVCLERGPMSPSSKKAKCWGRGGQGEGQGRDGLSITFLQQILLGLEAPRTKRAGGNCRGQPSLSLAAPVQRALALVRFQCQLKAR